ncbi:MAG: phosphoribosyltransferase [Erysipelotrichales bacterium]|nr:phosphoribosyltransferase [Erysipelotrichales bacterium]
MKTLREFILNYKEKERQYYNESNWEDDSEYIPEGLEINLDGKIVKLNDTSEGVDFNGPIYWNENGIEIISIFKRTNLPGFSKNTDGNPFIYALKNKFGWKFDITDKEIYKYCKKFVQNCEKLQRKFDTIIMIPSRSKVNERFMEEISKFVKSDNEIEDFFVKATLSHEDNEDLIDLKRLEKDFPNELDRRIEIRKLINLLDEQNDMYEPKEFEAKSFPKKYLKYCKFLQLNKNADYVDMITDKDVLILDDIYSSGETISHAVRAIQQNYLPKSITVITLLSKKF